MMEFFERIATSVGMERVFHAHKHHLPRMGKVLMIGGIGFIIQTLLFETIAIWLQLIAASTATALGAEVAIVSNFSLNERFSFRDSINPAVPLWRRFIKFNFVSLGSLLTQWVCVRIAEHVSTGALALNAAFLIGVGIGFIINYAGYYFLVWR